MSAPDLDDLDRRLIAVLANDARTSNRRIAADLGVTEGTVRTRLKRLQQEKLIAFTAITSFDMTAPRQMAFIRAQTDIPRASAIAAEIAAMSEVDAVMVTMGRYNLLVVCLFDTLADLHDLASNRILGMAGVHHVTTSIAVKTLKYNARVVRITDPDPSDDD